MGFCGRFDFALGGDCLGEGHEIFAAAVIAMHHIAEVTDDFVNILFMLNFVERE